MKLAFQVVHGHFWPVYLLQVSKNEDEKHCFLNDLVLVYIALSIYNFEWIIFQDQWKDKLYSSIETSMDKHAHQGNLFGPMQLAELDITEFTDYIHICT